MSSPIGNQGELAKRSLTEFERQQAHFLRSVKQKTYHSSPISPLSPSSSSTISHEIPTVASPFSYSSERNGYYGFPQRQQQNPNPATESGSETMWNRLQELERRLLEDDDEDDVCVSGSAVTVCELSDSMQELVSPTRNPLSPSSSSSSASSSSTPSKKLLFDAASAIADGNYAAATGNLVCLNQSSNPRGDPDQRLTAYMVYALVSRINPPPAENPPIAELFSAEHLFTTSMLYDSSPCFKLALMAANLAILESTKHHTQIHIIDFDIRQGGQYLSLINTLAELHRRRTAGIPHVVKITAVTDPTSPLNYFNNDNAANLRIVGERITKLAERVGVGVRFNAVSLRAAEVDHSTLGCEAGEAVAVNFAFSLSKVADESVSPANPRDELLRRVRGLRPQVVALVEEEMSSNTAPFSARFEAAFGHYGAVMESLEATMERESVERMRVEACLGRKAKNSVAREGAERVERCEVFGKWRARMGMAGFRPSQLGPGFAESLRGRIGLGRSNPGFTVEEENGGIGFGWMGRALTVVSAWC